MLTMRENYMIAMRGGKPEWVPSMIEETNEYYPSVWAVDPDTGVDFMNVKYVVDDFGPMADPKWKAMDDISEWRDIVRFPDLSEYDWEGEAAGFKAGDGYDPDKADVLLANAAGLFLIPVNMMGWVDALCTVYEQPDDLKAFVDALTDFLCEVIERACQVFKPDIVFTGDDFSSAKGPFISQDVFREFWKPGYTRVCETIHAQGALAEFHNCGRNGYLIDEILDMGYDSMQLPVPDEDLYAAKERYGSRLVIDGGWDRHGPAGMPGASEECVRESVRKAIDDFGSDGALIFWDGGIIGSSEDSKQKMAWLLDELHTYGHEVYGTAPAESDGEVSYRDTGSTLGASYK